MLRGLLNGARGEAVVVGLIGIARRVRYVYAASRTFDLCYVTWGTTQFSTDREVNS